MKKDTFLFFNYDLIFNAKKIIFKLSPTSFDTLREQWKQERR